MRTGCLKTKTRQLEFLQGLPGIISLASITNNVELVKLFMRYSEFEGIMSIARMRLYLQSVGGNSRKAMRLYRLNLKLSQELFYNNQLS